MDITAYLPEYMKEYREIKEKGGEKNPELKAAADNVSALGYEFFAETASQRGVERFEKILDITPSDEESLDYRKFRIKTRLAGIRQSVEAILDSLIPNGGWVVEHDEQSFKLTVGLSLINRSYLEEAGIMLDKLLPANIEIECGMLYSTHRALSMYKHSQLKAYTHGRLIYSI